MIDRQNFIGYNIRMNKMELIIGGVAILVINVIASLGIFVKFSDMAAYAVSKDSYQESIDNINRRLDSIDNRLLETNRDVKLLLKYIH